MTKNNSFSITDATNSVIITSGDFTIQCPKNSLILVSDNTDVIILRTVGSRKSVAELVWSWLDGATDKANAIETISSLIFA